MTLIAIPVAAIERLHQSPVKTVIAPLAGQWKRTEQNIGLFSASKGCFVWLFPESGERDHLALQLGEVARPGFIWQGRLPDLKMLGGVVLEICRHRLNLPAIQDNHQYPPSNPDAGPGIDQYRVIAWCV